jgi:hypothetical protein
MNISDTLDADKSFETIGLCNYFGDNAAEEVDWDNFFQIQNAPRFANALFHSWW